VLFWGVEFHILHCGCNFSHIGWWCMIFELSIIGWSQFSDNQNLARFYFLVTIIFDICWSFLLRFLWRRTKLGNFQRNRFLAAMLWEKIRLFSDFYLKNMGIFRPRGGGSKESFQSHCEGLYEPYRMIFWIIWNMFETYSELSDHWKKNFILDLEKLSLENQ